MPFGRHPSAKTKETTKAGKGPLLRINRKDCDVPTKKKVRRRRTLFCCGGRAKPLYPFRVLWRLFSTLSRLCESFGHDGTLSTIGSQISNSKWKGKKKGGIRLREIERERETRRRRRRVKKNDDDDVVFFCALCSHHRRRRPQRERYKNTSSLSTFPHLTCEKRRLFNAFFFPKNIKKEIPTTTTTMPRVVAAAAQQKTNTTVGAALLTDRASRTLIETQLRVALDAVCYQRGARERRRGNDGPFFFLSRRRSILNFETRAVDDDDDDDDARL